MELLNQTNRSKIFGINIKTIKTTKYTDYQYITYLKIKLFVATLLIFCQNCAFNR